MPRSRSSRPTKGTCPRRAPRAALLEGRSDSGRRRPAALASRRRAAWMQRMSQLRRAAGLLLGATTLLLLPPTGTAVAAGRARGGRQADDLRPSRRSRATGPSTRSAPTGSRRAWAPTTSSPTSSRPRTTCSSRATSPRSAAPPTSPSHPEFADRRTTKVIDGDHVRGRVVHRGLHARRAQDAARQGAPARRAPAQHALRRPLRRSRPSRRSSSCATGSRRSCTARSG